jgi:hydroxypyruvate isomerase
VLHNLPAGDWAAGERGIACHPDRVGEFRRGVDQAITYATALGCKQLNYLAGILPPDVAPGHGREVRSKTFASPQQSWRAPDCACWLNR